MIEAKRALLKAKNSLERAVGSSLVAYDGLRKGIARNHDNFANRENELGAPPRSVFVAMPHWRYQADQRNPLHGQGAEQRSQFLVQSVESALGIESDQVVVVVVTNAAESTAADLAAGLPGSLCAAHPSIVADVGTPTLQDVDGARAVLVMPWAPKGWFRHPYYLTWAHKPLLRRAVGDPRFSHFIYMEDDVRFTRASFSYWCSYRMPLAEQGLIPGFVTYELFEGAAYEVGQDQRQRTDGPSLRCTRRGAEAGEDLLFLPLHNPYQPLYVLDRALAAHHFRYSPYRDALRSRAARASWDTRARAASGPIYDEVPAGFPSRNVVPIREGPNGRRSVEESALIEHLGARYASDEESPWGNIRLDELFSD